MTEKNERSAGRLRCKQGGFAQITKAWNELLEGRVVFVVRAYSSTQWLVLLVDEPALVESEKRTGFVTTRTMIADDWALQPL